MTRSCDPVNDPFTVAVYNPIQPSPTRIKFPDGEIPEPFWISPDGYSSLYLGEALNMLSGIPDESIDCVWTDPPYLLSNGGITLAKSKSID